MKTIYRSSDVSKLTTLAAALTERGFHATLTIPDDPWVSGNPYIATDATNRDILEALRALRAL